MWVDTKNPSLPIFSSIANPVDLSQSHENVFPSPRSWSVVRRPFSAAYWWSHCVRGFEVTPWALQLFWPAVGFPRKQDRCRSSTCDRKRGPLGKLAKRNLFDYGRARRGGRIGSYAKSRRVQRHSISKDDANGREREEMHENTSPSAVSRDAARRAARSTSRHVEHYWSLARIEGGNISMRTARCWYVVRWLWSGDINLTTELQALLRFRGSTCQFWCSDRISCNSLLILSVIEEQNDITEISWWKSMIYYQSFSQAHVSMVSSYAILIAKP